MGVIEPKNAKLKSLIVSLSVLVMAITLSAGLWPFSFHRKNEVWWKPALGGLYFGETGMVISRGKFAGVPANGGLSIELWIEPSLTWGSNTILSFYEPEIAPRIQVRQSADDLVFTSSGEPQADGKKQRNVFVDRVFRKGERILVTLTSSDDVLDIYINGVLKKSVRHLEMRSADFDGILIVATAPNGNLSWRGTYHGLAVYDRALRPAEISEDYDLWQHNKELIARKAAQAYSLYLFNEQSGESLHNVGKAGPDLMIPKNYFIFQPKFFVPFWKEFYANWEYVKDLALNVLGLVPMGLCFAALFAWLAGRESSFLYTTLLGFCVSLTIEVLQAFMPARFSGTTDLITNTSGAALGAWLYLNAYSQVWLKRWGIVQTE